MKWRKSVVDNSMHTHTQHSKRKLTQTINNAWVTQTINNRREAVIIITKLVK